MAILNVKLWILGMIGQVITLFVRKFVFFQMKCCFYLILNEMKQTQQSIQMGCNRLILELR